MTEVVQQSWSNEDDAHDLKLTVSDETDTMMLEGTVQQDGCGLGGSICKDMMFMGQCDNGDGVGPGDYALSATEQSPVVVVFREQQQTTPQTTPTSDSKSSRKRSKQLFGRKSRSNSQQTTDTPTNEVPESVDVIHGPCVQDMEFSDYAIEVCSSPCDEIDELCTRQGWPRS